MNGKFLKAQLTANIRFGDPIWNQTGYRGFDVGLNLKSTSGWNESGNGSGLYGYEALPGGFRDYNGGFHFLTYNAYFWSSSEYSSSYAWYRSLYYGYDEVYRTTTTSTTVFLFVV